MLTDRRPSPALITGTKALAWVAWALVLAGSIGLSVLAAQHDRLPGDLRLTEWLQDSPVPGLELSRAVRAVTTTQVVLATGFAVAIALWLLGRRRQAIALAVALAVLPLAQHGIKEVVDRPRPSPELVDVRSGFSSPSFPSGHVMSPTMLYGFLLWEALQRPANPRRLHRAARVAVATWAAGVLVLAAPANVYVGVHWPSDILGGYAWGTVLLLPAILIASDRRRRQSDRRRD
jgi:membrane-associated phospholipid phosphatase